MKRASQLVLVLAVLASLMTINAMENSERAYRRLANTDDSGVLSIDCGVNETYTDPTTNMQYQADDATFVQFGEIYKVSSEYTFDDVPQIRKQLNSLRSFPDGKRNCYTLKPKQGKNKSYFIRAYFAYGNYDKKNELPTFKLYLGVNYIMTIAPDDSSSVERHEVIQFTTTSTIDVCLVNINQGVPFISLLELRPLDNSIYQNPSTRLPQALETRSNLGMFEIDAFIRYMDDVYGRSWYNRDISNSWPINTGAAIDLEKLGDPYKLPTEVLSTAVKALSLSDSLDLLSNFESNFTYYVYLHFFDFEERANNTQQRIMDITIGSVNAVSQPVTLPYWEPRTIHLEVKEREGDFNISLTATSDSDLPAMLNAYEIYRVVPRQNSATEQDDVDAIRKIKDAYKIHLFSWQGDPCGPTNFKWERLNCSYGDNPRIISLNLSSSNLSGRIDDSFSNLTDLETLDLSNNELTGEVPQFFAQLSKLKILNLSRNKLTGSIPESLKAKLNNPLQLSLDGNPNLCQSGLCKINKKKPIVPLVASIVASIAVTIIVVITMVLRRLGQKRRGTIMSPSFKKDDKLKSKNQAFTYLDVCSITDDFKTVIGKGGFGNVYLGTLPDGRDVAVKILSSSSMQGCKEFQSEAQLLMIVHHRNLVSLIGYCDEGDTKALIYEYLSKGNLQQQLSDKNPNVLELNERLQIALDAANGLDYLHNGCKPPIIHRDLKTTNILLDESMRAKISDFGLSRAFANDMDSYVSTCPAGTPGYLDPEFHSSGNFNRKSDVYSFGIILLELITGQPAIRGTPNNLTYILPWVRLKLERGDIQAIVDPRLQRRYSTALAWKFVEIAMSCVPQVAIQRPDISHIVSELKDCLSLETALERTENNVNMSSNLFNVGSLQIELDMGPNPR